MVGLLFPTTKTSGVASHYLYMKKEPVEKNESKSFDKCYFDYRNDFRNCTTNRKASLMTQGTQRAYVEKKKERFCKVSPGLLRQGLNMA